MYSNKKRQKNVWIILLLILLLICCWILFPLHVPKSEKMRFISETNKHYFQSDDGLIRNYYLDSDDQHDYYFQVCFDSRKDGYTISNIYATKIIKTNGENIIYSFDLSQLTPNDEIHFIFAARFHNGYLYFSAETDNNTTCSIFRIDNKMEVAELYIKSSKYGEISLSSISFNNDDIIYIADSCTVVSNDGEKETKLCTIQSPIEYNEHHGMLADDYMLYTGDKEINNLIVCYNGKEIYCISGNHLYHCDKLGILKRKRLLNVDYFYDLIDLLQIDFCEYNTDLLKITIRKGQSFKAGGKKCICVFNPKTYRKAEYFNYNLFY